MLLEGDSMLPSIVLRLRMIKDISDTQGKDKYRSK
jgi:hypothetical protein